MNKRELIQTISQELNPLMSQEKIALILDKAFKMPVPCERCVPF